MNIICIAQWLFVGDSEILHFSDIFARHQKLCKPESIFKQRHVIFFLLWKYDVISQLCQNYAKGPFCVSQLMYKFHVDGSAESDDLLIHEW